MTISTVIVATSSAFPGGGAHAASESSLPKDKEALKKWLNRLAGAFKKLAGKVIEVLSDIVRSDVGATLCFIGKAVRFVVAHTWALIIVVAWFIGLWLMQKVKK